MIGIVCLATNHLCQAQGTVNFANIGAEFNAPVYVDFVGGTPASTDWMAQLLLDEGGSLTAVGNPANFLQSAPGYFNGGVVTVTQVPPGGNGTFRVFAWDGASGQTTYAAAIAAWNSGVIRAGYSNPVTILTGGAGTPAAPPGALVGLESWSATVVPEPSIILLGLMGAGTLLLRHRG